MERMTAVINEGENPAAGKKKKGGKNTTTTKREGEEIEKADKTKKERKMKWRKINHRGNN